MYSSSSTQKEMHTSLLKCSPANLYVQMNTFLSSNVLGDMRTTLRELCIVSALQA